MVNTFLPFPDFAKSLAVLDNKRCGKQRVEAKQLIDALFSGTKWQNHPACKMWIGYEDALIHYYNLSLDEWESRGFNNTMPRLEYNVDYAKPWWLGWDHFHESHKASLMRKFPDYYSDKFEVSDFYMQRGYIWPAHHDVHALDYDDIDSLFAEINLDTIKPTSKADLYTVVQLRTMAKEQGHRGYSKLKKNELMELLEL